MKKHIIDQIMANTSCTQAEASRTLDEVTNAIAAAVRLHGEARIQGFGTFRRVTSKERNTTNPRTGAPMVSPSRTTLKFRASKQLTV